MSSKKQGDGAAPDNSATGADDALSEPPVMSPRLLKRLGEAAMGTPRSYGKQFWICRYERDPKTKSYDIDGPFHNKREAKVAINERPGFGIFGPYKPAKDEGLPSMVSSSVNVSAVLVYVEGKKQPIEIPVNKFDALFWKTSPIEKFVFPYYCSAEGLEYAVQVRDEYVKKDAYLMAHSDDTEYSLWGASRAEGFLPVLEPLEASR